VTDCRLMMFSFLCLMYFCEFVVLYSGAHYDNSAALTANQLESNCESAIVTEKGASPERS
jgi:hypothetical protein